MKNVLFTEVKCAIEIVEIAIDTNNINNLNDLKSGTFKCSLIDQETLTKKMSSVIENNELSAEQSDEDAIFAFDCSANNTKFNLTCEIHVDDLYCVISFNHNNKMFKNSIML
jgi:hypothetical protein